MRYGFQQTSPLQILQDGFLLGLGLSKQNIGTLFVSRSACDPTSLGHPQNSLTLPSDSADC
jgi:hypothetical protein